MHQSTTAQQKGICAHGFPPLLCQTCVASSVCVHGMVRDCLLCGQQRASFLKRGPKKPDTSFWREPVSASWNRPQAAPSKTPATVLPFKPTNASSLKLGINERYRSAILLAAQRTGLDPAGIAAVINAEAAPLQDRKTREKLADEVFRAAHPERDWDQQPLNAKAPADAPLIKAWKQLYTSSAWDEHSYNDKSSAAGLTQFIKSTWRDEAIRLGTYLNGYASEHGFLDKNSVIIPSRDAELLDLRYDPTLSIVAAAEYDQHAFDRVSQKKFVDTREVDKVFFAKYSERDFTKQPLQGVKDAVLIQEWKQISSKQSGRSLLPSDLSSDQKARYLYLCHHEGVQGAIAILSGTLSNAAAQGLLDSNVPEKSRQDALIKEHGSVSKAYTQWLWSYIDQNIQPSGFRQ